MVVPTLKSDILIKMYESIVNIVQLCNLAKLRKWKNKYIIKFVKVGSLPSQPILASPPLPPAPYGPSPLLKMKKMQTPLKKTFENQKVLPYSLGEDTMLFLAKPPPPLNLQTVQAPFLGNLSLYISFLWTPLP